MRNFPKNISVLYLLFQGALITPTIAAEKFSLQILPDNYADILQKTVKVETAKLNIIPVIDSHKFISQETGRIAGYPVQATIKPLKNHYRPIVDILLGKTSYVRSVIRCENSFMGGLRFTKNNKK